MTNKLKNLKNFNLKMAALHAIQGLIMLAISNDFSLPVNSSFLNFNEQTESLESATTQLFDIPFAWLIVAFLFMSSIAHLVIATVGNKQYNKDLKNGLNRFRWFEYAASASTMMVAIAMLVGIYDASSLLMIFVMTAVMNLMGLVMEVHNQLTKKTNWLSYYIGVLSGAIPWIAIGIYFLVSSSQGSSPPTFVYFIYFSIFAFFNTFAINMVLQYKKVGKWSDYIYGERAYIILSLVAKSALAWQVYAGTLQPV